jgi:hypothetical protein
MRWSNDGKDEKDGRIGLFIPVMLVVAPRLVIVTPFALVKVACAAVTYIAVFITKTGYIRRNCQVCEL